MENIDSFSLSNIKLYRTYILFIGIKRNIGTKEPLQNNYCLYKIFFATVIEKSMIYRLVIMHHIG